MRTGTLNASDKDEHAYQTDPVFSWRDILKQIKLDLVDKEVQSAATYSYLWLADQAGHVCIGIVCHFLIYFILSFSIATFWPLLYNTGGVTHISVGLYSLAISCTAFILFELHALRQVKKRATGLFPLNAKGLKRNALAATFYLTLGSIVGLSFQLGLIGLGFQFFGLPIDDGMPLFFTGVSIFIGALICFVWPIRFWLSQKIIWQKAGLPYLYRLANMPKTIQPQHAVRIQEILGEPAPPHSEPCQIVIHGPPDSGRTQLAAGIGTEFAFRGRKVRYLTFDKFKELIANGTTDPGPQNINYWSWQESQILIIDDISPYVDEERKPADSFRQLISPINTQSTPKKKEEDNTTQSTVLSTCHTVWVLGGGDHEPWVETIKEMTNGTQPDVFGLTVPAPKST